MRNRTGLQFSPGAAGPLDGAAAPQRWRFLADCQYTDPNLFFPGGGDDPEQESVNVQVAQARLVCLGCPVRPDCLSYALDTRQVHGIWAGLTRDELRAERMRRARRSIPEILAAADERHQRLLSQVISIIATEAA